MDNKLLVVVGPTAIGKTSLALKLAKKFNGDILSADSRQVYKDLGVITGKSLPVNSKYEETATLRGRNLKLKNAKNLGYWVTSDNVRIWLMDLVDPREEFSVALWNKAFKSAYEFVSKDNKLPILVGGTGLYVKSVTGGIETIEVPLDKNLREAKKSAEELYDLLEKIDPLKAASLNPSDRKNPVRLVRAVEIANWKTGKEGISTQAGMTHISMLIIGLTAPIEVVYRRVNQNVDKRVSEGALFDVKKILESGVLWSSQSIRGFGFKELKSYFIGGLSKEGAISKWKAAERRYARQQLAWFKKDKKINWFDITDKNFEKKVEKLVRSWYDNKSR